MTGILKDFDFTIAYLDNIIFLAEQQKKPVTHQKGIPETLIAKLSMKLVNATSSPRKFIFRTYLSTKAICLLPLKTQAIQKIHPLTTPKQVHDFLGLVGYYRKFIQDFAKIARPLTLFTRQKVKFEWTSAHHEAFLKLKDFIIQAPNLWYSNPSKRYIVYTDASDDACRAQLTQNTMAWNSQLPSYLTLFQRPKENGAQLNKRPMEFTMLSPSGITISRVQTS